METLDTGGNPGQQVRRHDVLLSKSAGRSAADGTLSFHGNLEELNSDRSVRDLKGPGRPLVPEADRAALIAALRPVSAVTIFDEPTPLETILSVRPDVLVKGSEYSTDDIVGAREIRAWGGKVVRVPMRAGWSTSQIIATIRNESP